MAGLIPIKSLLAQIEEDPIEGAKLAQKRYRDGVRNATYESSVSAGALYRELKESKPLQGAFYSLPFWEGGNARDPKHLNKHCHQFIYGAREGSEGKRAEDHAFATQSYYDDESKTLDQILEALKKGGFDGFKKAAQAQETRVRLKEMEAPERKRSNADDKAKGSGNAGGDATLVKSPTSGRGEPANPRWPKMTMKEIFEHLLVTMTAEELAQFLPDASDEGDLATIHLMRDKNPTSERAIWRALDIEFQPQSVGF